jgi:hypothetical protein
MSRREVKQETCLEKEEGTAEKKKNSRNKRIQREKINEKTL